MFIISLLFRLLLPLFCLVACSAVYATERVRVDPYIKAGPGYTASNGSLTGYVPTKSNQDLLLEAERKGWLGSSSSKTPVTVKPKVKVPVGGLAGKLKNALKVNPASLAFQATVSAAVAGVGWVMDEGTKVVKKPVPDTMYKPISEAGWCMGFGDSSCQGGATETIDSRAPTASAVASKVLDDFKGYQTHPSWQSASYELTSCNATQCEADLISSLGVRWHFNIKRYGSCTAWEGSGGGCPSDTPQYEPVSDFDLDMLDPWLNAQSAAWLKDLLKDVCEGSNNPQGCYDDLQKQSAAIITGPSSVPGPSLTSSGTYTRADGTTGTSSSTSQTTYNIRYGDNYFDYDTTVTTTTTKDGQQVSEDTTTDEGEPQEEPKDEDEKEEEQKPERLASGEACNTTLMCSGDAIDCAALRQQKAMRCSLDWPTQSASVQAEASKPEYKLKEVEVDASSLFSGASASRWLPSYCPPDSVVYLETIQRSVPFSWSLICQFSSALSYLCVGLASLFFAIYVGRSFGGD